MSEQAYLVRLVGVILAGGLIGTTVGVLLASWMLPPDQPLLGALMGSVCAGAGAIGAEAWYARRAKRA